MLQNMAGYKNVATQRKGRFFYTGTDAIEAGIGMCFDLDYLTTSTGETATDSFGGRGLKAVQKPTNGNNLDFAGVTIQSYKAKADGLGQVIELAMPGGCAMVRPCYSTTINSGFLTAIVGSGVPGRFGPGGLPGRGSAIPLQTLIAATGGDLGFVSVAGVGQSVYDEATGLTTITDTGGIGTALGYGGTTVTATDYEVTLFGGTEGSAGAGKATPGIYPVVAATAANTITVTGDTGDADLAYVAIKKNVKILVYLMPDGESGCSEIISPESGTAVQHMVGGTTFVIGGMTVDVASTATLADGTREGMQKAFYLLGTLTTGFYIVTVTNGLVADGSTGLSTITLEAAGDLVVMAWRGGLGGIGGGEWCEVVEIGGVLS